MRERQLWWVGLLLCAFATHLANAGCGSSKNQAQPDGGANDAGTDDSATVDAGVDAGVTTVEVDIPAGDVTIHAWITGGGSGSPDLVMVNGGPGLTHDYMTPLASLATPTRRVVMYDQRGVGKSTMPAKASYGQAAYVADLEAVRSYLGVDRVHLLGHSFGGWIVEAYVEAHPDKVASLILSNAEPPDDTDLAAGETHFSAHVMDLQNQGILPKTMPTSSCAWFTTFLPAYFAVPKLPTPKPLSDTGCSDTVSADTSTALGGPFDFRPAYASLVLPVLVVDGQQDPFGPAWPAAETKAFAAAKPASSTLPNTGHFPWLELPQPFYDAITPFIDANVGP